MGSGRDGSNLIFAQNINHAFFCSTELLSPIVLYEYAYARYWQPLQHATSEPPHCFSLRVHAIFSLKIVPPLAPFWPARSNSRRGRTKRISHERYAPRSRCRPGYCGIASVAPLAHLEHEHRKRHTFMSALTSSPSPAASPRASFHPRYTPTLASQRPSKSPRLSAYSSPGARTHAPASAPNNPSPRLGRTITTPTTKPTTADAGTQYTPDGLPPTAPANIAGNKRKGESPPPSMTPSSTLLNPPPEPDVRTAPTAQIDEPAATLPERPATEQEQDAPHSPSAAKRPRTARENVKTMPLAYETCDPKDLGFLISNMLMELIRLNDQIPLSGRLTRFHSRYALPFPLSSFPSLKLPQTKSNILTSHLQSTPRHLLPRLPATPNPTRHALPTNPPFNGLLHRPTLRPLPRLHNLESNSPPFPDHRRNRSRKRAIRQFLDEPDLRAHRRNQHFRTGDLGNGVLA